MAVSVPLFRFLVVCSLLCGAMVAQQADPAPTASNGSNPAADQGQSLGEMARKVRKDHTAEVQMSDADAKELFKSVDKIVAFAAEDSGFPKRTSVKRRLVSSAEVEQYTRDEQAKEGYAQRFARSELTMKKFGLLPREFNLREFVVKANGKQIAAYYDDETKTISMLNWIPLERQAPILAHELTHALQDQNYDLKAWLNAARGTPQAGEKKDSNPEIDDDSAGARRAAVEGQAQIVFVDYILAPVGRSLQNTPGLIYQMEEPAVKASADSQLLHDAPMILREVGTFPYREGLIFEGELLEKGGKAMAFSGVFARPPRNAHEVLQPIAYINREKLAAIRIPDVAQILSDKYAVYDSGGIGELDVRALLKTYGNRKEAETLAGSWQGGAYLAFRRSAKAAADTLTTADLSLLYVSRWKSPASAERFAHIYATAIAQRYQSATPQNVASCAGATCPAFAVQVLTEEGPVIVQQWADNTVLISESFDQITAGKLVDAVRQGNAEVQADNVELDELSLRLYDLPEFSAFQARIGDGILRELERETK
jgi:phosphopantetheinyl transferase (holo-ACP synthase)